MAKASQQLMFKAANVELARNHTQNVRFRAIPRLRKVRITTIHQPPLFVEKLDNGKFIVAPRNELPVQANTPREAAAKGMKRFWKF